MPDTSHTIKGGMLLASGFIGTVVAVFFQYGVLPAVASFCAMLFVQGVMVVIVTSRPASLK